MHRTIQTKLFLIFAQIQTDIKFFDFETSLNLIEKKAKLVLKLDNVEIKNSDLNSDLRNFQIELDKKCPEFAALVAT